MITAELSYNPYLREMAVKFNGQPPHINSLVEKYQDCPLQDWVTEIPFIFHDEMNGYGFELDFCGTELDFDEVRNAFHMQAVSESEVQIILKNALECREATRVETGNPGFPRLVQGTSGGFSWWL